LDYLGGGDLHFREEIEEDANERGKEQESSSKDFGVVPL